MSKIQERDTCTAKQWLAVVSIAAGTFLLVTTEFLPIGLLSRLAGDLHVSDGVAGLSVMAPGLVAALSAPASVLLAGTMDRRIVIAALTASIIVSNVIAVVAHSFPVFLLGRFILGLAVGGLWTFAVAVGRRLVPESAGARATSIISAGISAGTIFGMPVGAVLGAWVGWRALFAANAVFGLLVVCVQLRVLPRLTATKAIDVAKLAAFAKGKMARIGLVASGFVAAGHFIAYTFLDPFLRNTLGLGPTGVPLALAGYAATGIVGSFIGEKVAAHDIRRAFIFAAALLGIAVFGSIVLAKTTAAAIAMVLVWGTAFGAIPVCVQIWMFTSSPALYEAGSALMVSAFQISLSAGAAIGGLFVDSVGLGTAFVVASIACCVGAAIALFFRADPVPVDHGAVVLGDVR